jgi:hypothetical protein
MAAVYQAADLRTNRIVALKEMSQDGLSPEDLRDALASFAFEADTLARLRHPNLPGVYERFSIGARHYLAMEYIDGQTLEQRQRAAGNKPLPEAEVLDWARQLCDVLTYLHGQRPPIIFRDLKPGNVMLTAKGEIKLIDFGIARVFSPGRTQDTQLLGTPGFAPPEQYGKAQTDPRADVYALGCTLYALLTGYDPGTTPFALPPMHTRNPALSPHVQRAIERATQHDREQRYPSADAFARDLLHPEGLIYRAGQCAHNAQELLALCRSLPHDSAEHLAYGRIEAWLRTRGEGALAQAAAQARAAHADRDAALAAFLQRADTLRAQRSFAKTATRGNSVPAAQALAQLVALLAGTHARTQAHAPARPQPAAKPKLSNNVVVQPASLYFGRIQQGQREERTLSISGRLGAFAQGQITSSEPWLVPDRLRFSAPSTMVRLAVETGRMAHPGAHQAKLTITSDAQRIDLPVTVDVAPAPAPSAAPAPAARQAMNQAAHRAKPRKYAFPAPARSRGARMVQAFALALALASGALVLAHAALTQWTQISTMNPWIFAGLLMLAALAASAGAVVADMGKGVLSRARTSLGGALLGLVASWALAGSHLLAARGALAMDAVGHPWILALPLGLVGAGAALGADAEISRAMLRLVAQLGRWRRPLLVTAGLALGAWGGWLLGAAVLWGILAGPLAILGALLGAWLAGGANRALTRRQMRARYARIRP